MSKKARPVPPANQSRKGTGSAEKPDEKQDKVSDNLDEQIRQGNIRQNTRTQGYRRAR
jgi:hypothetical protein